MEEDMDTYYEIAMVRANELLALKHNDGWMVARIADGGYPAEYVRAWPACAAVTAMGPQDTTLFNYMMDTVNGALTKVFLNDSQDESTIEEYYFGWSEPQAEVWMEYPDGGPTRRQMRPDLGSPQLLAASSSAFGKLLRGGESPIHAPTTKGRIFLPHSLDQQPKWAVWNPTNKAFTLRQRIIRNVLKFEALRPQDPDDARLIEAVLRKQITKGVTRWSPGIEGWAINNFRKTYGVDPVMWKRIPGKGLVLSYQAIDNKWYPLGE